MANKLGKYEYKTCMVQGGLHINSNLLQWTPRQAVRINVRRNTNEEIIDDGQHHEQLRILVQKTANNRKSNQSCFCYKCCRHPDCPHAHTIPKIKFYSKQLCGTAPMHWAWHRDPQSHPIQSKYGGLTLQLGIQHGAKLGPWLKIQAI